ncbi:YggT family protein [Maricaulis sp. CAU 1757]
MTLLQALLFYFVLPLLNIILILVFVGVIMSWLINFNVINANNQFVYTIWRMTNAVTEPLLSPIRRILPPLGGLDFSPIVLLLIIMFVKGYVVGGVLCPLFGDARYCMAI